MTKSDRLWIRVTPDLKSKIEKAAAADSRTVTNWVEMAIRAALKTEKEIDG